MKKNILFAVSILVLCGIGYIVLKEKEPQNYTQNETEKTYDSQKYGFSFSYPSDYFLEEKDLSTPQREHYALILTEDTDENRLVREGKSPEREGPVSVTFDIYKLASNEASDVPAWIQTTGGNASNWKLHGRNLRETEMSGKSAFTYEWSGLYEAMSTVFEHNGSIVMITATYITPEDPILKVFDSLLTTLDFK